MRTKIRNCLLPLAVLAITSLACALTSTGTRNTTSPAQETPVPPAAEAPAVQLGDEFRCEEGGYSFDVIPGYSVESMQGFAFLQAADADPDDGPFVVFIGEQHSEDVTLDQLYQVATLDFGDEVDIIDHRDLPVAGYPARLVKVKGTGERGNPMEGQMVVVLVSPRQTLTSFATAPSERWSGELGPAYAALLASLRFFEPQQIAFDLPLGDQIDTGEILHQWAVDVEATSSYDDPDWGPMQAAGPPNTHECGDLPTAWGSLTRYEQEVLTLRYEQPVIPLGIYIHQTHAPSQIEYVELIDIYNQVHVVYDEQPWLEPDCPYVLEVAGFMIDVPVDTVIVHINHIILDTSWNQIDAVELVGLMPVDIERVSPTGQNNPAWEAPADSARFGPYTALYEEFENDIGDSTFSIMWESSNEVGDFNDAYSGGFRQDQSTSAEYVIGMVAKNNRPAVSLFLPVGQQSGQYALKPYDAASPTKGPSLAMYLGVWLYVAEEGQLEIEISADGKITGKVLAYLVSPDDPEKDAVVYLRMRDLSLK